MGASAFTQDVRRFDQGTHNTAEWQALILGLRLALKHGERYVVVKGDSMLVVKQVNREWKTKNPALRSLRTEADEVLALFESWRVEWIPRKENRRADELATSALDEKQGSPKVRHRPWQPPSGHLGGL